MESSRRHNAAGALGLAAVTAGTMLVTGAAGTAGAATTATAAGAARVTASSQLGLVAQSGHSVPALSWPVVKFGDKGDRVFAIQYLLRAVGYGVGPSGVFGGITRHDVAHFQKVRGLNPSGIVGSATWSRLIITVAFGSRGEAVKGVQQNLHFGYGYKNLPITGFFGPITRGDVRNFQAKHHIGVDGIVGPVTWNTIIRFES